MVNQNKPKRTSIEIIKKTEFFVELRILYLWWDRLGTFWCGLFVDFQNKFLGLLGIGSLVFFVGFFVYGFGCGGFFFFFKGKAYSKVLKILLFDLTSLKKGLSLQYTCGKAE